MHRILVLLTIAALIYFLVGFLSAVMGLLGLGAMALVVFFRNGRRAERWELARNNAKVFAYNASMRWTRGETLTPIESEMLLRAGWAVPEWRPTNGDVQHFVAHFPAWKEVHVVG
jgi:hypothetical protein